LYSATNGNFSCSGAVRHRHHRRTDYKPYTLSPRGHGTLTYDEQSYAALVCRLMVSNPVIHVITWTTNHLPTPKGRKAELAWLVDPQRTLYPRLCIMGFYVQDKSAW